MSEPADKVLIGKAEVDAPREARFRAAVALLKRLESDAGDNTQPLPADASALLKACSDIVDSASWDWQAIDK